MIKIFFRAIAEIVVTACCLECFDTFNFCSKEEQQGVIAEAKDKVSKIRHKIREFFLIIKP
ncbi:hypothetical protein [Flavobacterium sp. N1736]|uniref:hypothetical protein n=1 Tax=Flavobacterium sp. N1736 TaxID=2986823 RepID=UPI0022250855|nr:hypothetical protein [Flavobacterium sp. N1736]